MYVYIHMHRNFPRDVPWQLLFALSLVIHFCTAKCFPSLKMRPYLYVTLFPQNLLKHMMLTFLWLNWYFSGDQLRHPQGSLRSQMRTGTFFATLFQVQRCFTAFDGAFVFLKQVTSKIRENINTVSFRRLGKKCKFFS